MRSVVKKILFPFFNAKRHAILLEKWWFRAVFVLFLTVFFLSPPYLWMKGVDAAYAECLHYYGDSISEYPEAYGLCNDQARNAWTYPGVVGPALAQPIIVFYFIQFIFFGIIMNYIVLGSPKNKSNT